MFPVSSWVSLIIAILRFITACIDLYIYIDTKRQEAQDKQKNKRH